MALGFLKGLAHEIDLAFDDILYMISLSLNRGRGHFLNFGGVQLIL
jgi:hypothetical protein